MASGSTDKWAVEWARRMVEIVKRGDAMERTALREAADGVLDKLLRRVADAKYGLSQCDEDTPATTHARLTARANAYEHAAELLADAIERGEAEGTGHECATCGGCGSVEMSGGAHVAPCPQCVEADDG